MSAEPARESAAPPSLRAVPAPGTRTEQSIDPRVDGVLDVLAGRSVAEVALRLQTDPAVLHRWVRDFVAAGTNQVLNRPDPQAAAQRDRFLAAFAHEVRTPLTVAQGWVDLLVEGLVAPERHGHALGQLATALARLEARTLDVELMTAASLGRLAVSRETVTVGDLAVGIIGAEQMLGDTASTEVAADPQHLRTILRDLWQAAHLAPDPRRVHLHAVSLAPWVEIRVVRDADPIEPETLRSLFEPFDAADDRSGVTLGLYLARALVVAHGGTMGVDQNDHGAAFWVKIPHAPTSGTTIHEGDPR